MRLILTLAFSTFFSLPVGAYDILTFRSDRTPVELTKNTEGMIHVRCTTTDNPILLSQDSAEIVQGELEDVASIPEGGQIEPINETCGDLKRQEIWMSRSNQNSFLVYQRGCPDDPTQPLDFSNGGRVYQVGDPEIDQAISGKVKWHWQMGEVDKVLANAFECARED